MSTLSDSSTYHWKRESVTLADPITSTATPATIGNRTEETRNLLLSTITIIQRTSDFVNIYCRVGRSRIFKGQRKQKRKSLKFFTNQCHISPPKIIPSEYFRANLI
jgi:hypothetical protein